MHFAALVCSLVLLTMSFYLPKADMLRLDSSSMDDIDKLVINELLEVCASFTNHSS